LLHIRRVAKLTCLFDFARCEEIFLTFALWSQLLGTHLLGVDIIRGDLFNVHRCDELVGWVEEIVKVIIIEYIWVINRKVGIKQTFVGDVEAGLSSLCLRFIMDYLRWFLIQMSVLGRNILLIPLGHCILKIVKHIWNLSLIVDRSILRKEWRTV